MVCPSKPAVTAAGSSLVVSGDTQQRFLALGFVFSSPAALSRFDVDEFQRKGRDDIFSNLAIPTKKETCARARARLASRSFGGKYMQWARGAVKNQLSSSPRNSLAP